MGIFNFWGWFKNNFKGAIYKLNEKQNLETINIPIDNLLIDLNGLFHASTQKIYQYGTHKPKERLLKKTIIVPDNKLQEKVYEDICKNIENLFYLCKPKRIILAIDGPAPYAKIIQQRRRRFLSAMSKEVNDKSFDSNSLTPGTKFMDYLSKYIDWFIRKQISENPDWKDVEIVFSNEKNPGEGEAKLFTYIRNHGNKKESYIVHALDADIIMLSLGAEIENIYVLRDDLYDKTNKYFVVNINDVSLQLGEMMRWESAKYNYNQKNAIDDFIFLCIGENTPVSLTCGLSLPIQMVDYYEFPILSYNTNGIEQDKIVLEAIGPNNKGTKPVYKLTLLDGRELIVTPKHEIRTTRGYVKAKELNYGYNNTVISKDCSEYIIKKSKLVDDFEFIGSNTHEADCCLMGPDTFTLDIKNEINNTYSLHVSDIKDLTFHSSKDVYRTLAFSRIVGYLYANILNNRCCFTNKLDIIEIKKDIKIICGKTNVEEKYGCISLPIELYKSIVNLPSVIIDTLSFPSYLFESLTPASMIREFIGGFFGSIGETVNISSDFKNITNDISISQYTTPKYSENLQKIYNSLSTLLMRKLNIKSSVNGPFYNKENNKVKWSLTIDSALNFSEKISFRYSYNKQVKLSIACCWFRFRKNTVKQRKEMFKILYDETKNYNASYAFKKLKFINNPRNIDYKKLSIDELTKYCLEIGITSVNKAKSELINDINNYITSIPTNHPCVKQKFNKMPVLSIHSQFTEDRMTQYIRNILFDEKQIPESSFVNFVEFIRDEYQDDIEKYLKHCDFDIEHEIPFKDFVENIGAVDVFLSEGNILTYNLPIINIEKLNYDVNVYDLSIKNNHSFLANSCVVHNCFMIGNDFLPHIPSLEILEGGIDIILNIYRDIGTFNGHLIKKIENEITFSKEFLEIFLNMVSEYEKNILENKLKNRRIYFQDDILESCTTFTNVVPELDIKKYREQYCNFHFEKGDKNLKKVCHTYLEGLQWVITYYKKGCPDWRWFYPYNHVPSASIISKYLLSFRMPIYKKSFPLTPFQQLLAVLPPKSATLLPHPLNTLLLIDDSPLKEFCPEEFEIDLSGKKHEYQGIVILPMINPSVVTDICSKHINLVDKIESKRNILNKTLIYNYDSEMNIFFKSFYGAINNCKVKTKIINL